MEELKETHMKSSFNRRRDEARKRRVENKKRLAKLPWTEAEESVRFRGRGGQS